MRTNLEDYSKETLIELVRMYAQNWQTLDSLWFSNVESECGLDTAVSIDLKNWESQAVIEAERIKKILGLEEGGLSSVLTALSFMSWQLISPIFECEEESMKKVVFYYPHCSVQEGREKRGKPEFPCKRMKSILLSNLARTIEPKAKVKCMVCPPDPHPKDIWCKWELSIEQE